MRKDFCVCTFKRNSDDDIRLMIRHKISIQIE